MNLDERCARTERVIARFRNAPFSWVGRRTCIHLARAQMRALGHRPPLLPDIRSALSAERALRDAGHSDLADLLDSLLPRIAPAAMLVGDLALMAGDRMDAIVVAASGKVFGYAEGHDGICVIEPVGPRPFKAAWRL